MTEAYFFDTYAFFEITNGSANYEKHLASTIVTTKLNLFELYYGLLRKINEDLALFTLTKYLPFAIDFDQDTIEQAAKLKLAHKKQDLSMADCIGYTLAQKAGIPFLTGDKQFEHLPNVAFIK